MAHALPEARSILLVRSTRTHGGKTTSNIVWNYGHTTIPRHLRDLVVTEYGVADLRGRTDRDCVVALLGVTDARFQPSLLADAKRAGKIEAGYQLPDDARGNTREALDARFRAWRRRGLFSEFPFGTDFTSDEVVLLRALEGLQTRLATTRGRLLALGHSIGKQRDLEDVEPYLARVGIATPSTWKERLTARLLAAEIRRVREQQA
jgi:hypothetical protein